MVSLADKYPEIAALWHPNNSLKPNEVSFGTHKIVQWLCPISNEHIWFASVNALTNNRKKNINGRHKGCPFCHGLKICKSNSLPTTHPDLALEWNLSLNNISPSQVTSGSHTLIWWNCKTKTLDHIWQAAVKSRALRGDGCPFCRGLKVCKSNCLASTHADLIKEWDYNKNDKTPEQITSGSHYKAWWICNQNHKWKSTVKDRANKQAGCPFCYQSIGERKVEAYLKSNNISYEAQYKFNDCKRSYRLRFDFVIIDDSRVIGAVEYNGIQHYEPTGFGGDANQSFEYIKYNDKIKINYLIKNNIKYLEIPYTDHDQIESKLSSFIKEIKKPRMDSNE